MGDPATGDLRTAFEDHAAALLRLCTLLTGRSEVAEDLVQDAFVRLAPKIERLDAEAVWPYLRRIAVNLWKNRLRRLALEARHRHAEPATAPALDPGRTAVWSAVLSLPPRQRTTILLRYYEDLTEADTARVMGCSTGTVKSQTAKALAKLEQDLSDED
ncbi:MAG TPA: SigE family RNA polymerase sigma factor [Actinomycetota bacterium]